VGGWGELIAPQELFFWNMTPDIANFDRVLTAQKISIRLKNQTCRPSPVVWEKYRPKRSTRLGSWFFRPLFEHADLEFLGTKSPHFRVHEKRPKHENVKKVLRTGCSHLPSTPSVRNTPSESHLQTPYFGTPLIGQKLVGFLGRTDDRERGGREIEFTRKTGNCTTMRSMCFVLRCVLRCDDCFR
jgi:hypothetical protein